MSPTIAGFNRCSTSETIVSEYSSSWSAASGGTQRVDVRREEFRVRRRLRGRHAVVRSLWFVHSEAPLDEAFAQEDAGCHRVRGGGCDSPSTASAPRFRAWHRRRTPRTARRPRPTTRHSTPTRWKARCERRRAILPVVYALLGPRRVVDVGCGQGAWLAVAEELGSTELAGVDGAWDGSEGTAKPAHHLPADRPPCADRFRLAPRPLHLRGGRRAPAAVAGGRVRRRAVRRVGPRALQCGTPRQGAPTT